MSTKRWRNGLLGCGGAAVLAVLGLVAIYNIPAVNERLFWRVETLRADLVRLVRAQPETLPTPEISVTFVARAATSTLAPTEPPTATLAPSEAAATATLLPTEPPTATPLPEGIRLVGVPHEYQGWNNCGPATLSMNLRFWGWQGDQLITSAWLKPNQQDKNVRPEEIAAYVTQNVPGMQAAYRAGGTVELLRKLVAAGYPVIVGKGLWNGEQGWMGHYILVNGYDDHVPGFVVEDSLHGPDLSVPYDEFDSDWQSFNRLFVVVYPDEKADEVMALLGDHADLAGSFEAARATAQAETEADPNNAFAWHNLGTSLEFFEDYEASAAAFDQARVIGLPWRMLWYQTAIYSAYYHTDRFLDVRTLTNLTLESALIDIEENLYWRGWAKYALGDARSAARDFELALDFNPNYGEAQVALESLEGDSPAPQ